MATRSLNVVVTGDSKPLGVATKQADKHIAGVEKSAGRMGKAVKAGFAVAAVGTGALVVGLKKSVDAAVDAEKSQAKLKAQLNASGASYRAHAKEIDAVIQKHSRLAGVDDEDLQDAFTGIVRSTGKVSTAMKDMGLVTDIMRGKNVDAAAAGKILEKVHNGNVTALKKMGISIDPVTKAQDKLKDSNKNATREQIAAAKATDKSATAQKGIAELQKRFGGQAEAYGKTAAGAQDRFRVALENVQEKLGAKLLPVLGSVANGVSKFLSQIDRGTGAGGRFAAVVSGAFEQVQAAVQAAIPTAITVFEQLKTTITGVVQTVTGIVRGFQEGKGGAVALVSVITGLTAAFVAWKVAVTVASAATKVYAGVQAALNVVMSANPIGLVVLGLVALGAGLVVAYKKSETFRRVVDTAWAGIRDTTMAVLNWLVPAVKTAFGVVSSVVGVAVKIVRGYVGAYAAAAKAIVGAIIDAFNFLKNLPGKVAGFFSSVTKKIRDWVGNFASAALEVGKSIGKGIISGLGNLGHLVLDKVKDALDFVGSAIPGLGAAVAVGKAIGNKVGDGAGKAAGALGSGLPSGTFGGNLMGARPSMAPFASAAARFGLGVSSGRRPGSITSSGNVSYHSTGEAIDVAGNPQGMLGFFRQMKSKYGARLAELIFTPGGAGIKNGKPYTYGGQVAADHFDHVHVAFDSGVPGVGDGLGMSRGPSGDGIGFRGLEDLWVQGRGSTKMAPLMAHIAQAESGGDPNARNPSGASGLWQILGQPFPGNVFDPLTNAKMAVWKYRNQGLGAWAASRGAWGKYVGSKETYTSSGSRGSSGGSSKSKTYKKNQTASGGALGGYDPGVVYATENTAAEAMPPALGRPTGVQGFLHPTPPRPVKGGGPSKGISTAEGEARANAPEPPAGPTWEDYVMSGIARAKLTPGTEDDIAALTTLTQLRKEQMDVALSDGDPRNDSDAIDAYLAATEALKALTDSNSNLADALKGVQDEMKRQTDFATSVTATSNFQLTKSLADLLGGQIVGYGVAGRKFTPGTGVEYAY